MARTVNPSTQSRQTTPESGLRFDRCWFIRENTTGESPSNPDWQLYSDRLIEFEADLDPALERLEATGTPDAVNFGRAVEENEVTILYSLQQAIVDSDGEPVNACYDAFMRNEANQIPNTHSMVARDNNPSPGPHDPDGASGQRRYLVMNGGKADVAMEPDAEEADPIPVELTYMAEKVRSFQIYQPASPTTIGVVSTDDNDDSVEITIEDEGGNTSETIALNGEEPVFTEAEFGDIDAFELSTPADGDVTIHINDGEENAELGSQLAIIDGADSYAIDEGLLEGDLGVPALNDGSAPEDIDELYEDFGGDIIDFDYDANIPTPDLNNMTVEVDNDLDARPRQSTYRPAIEEGNREITIETDVVGERASHDMIREAYLSRPSTIVWMLSRTTLTFPDARCTEPPSSARAPDEAFAEIDGTWESIGIEMEAT